MARELQKLTGKSPNMPVLDRTLATFHAERRRKREDALIEALPESLKAMSVNRPGFAGGQFL